MASVTSISPELWNVQELMPETCIEWRLQESNPQDAGKTLGKEEARSLERDSPRVMHFAPGSWLVINGDATVSPSGLPVGLIGVDVVGKWIGFRLEGSLVDSVLRAEVQLGILLEKRHCAATSMFDCPILLHRAGDQHELWMQASYRDHLRAQLTETANRIADRLKLPSQSEP